MKLLAGAVFWLFLAGSALAQTAGETLLPALFDVVGVGADDALNIRQGPGVGFAVVGALAPDARGVEVVELDEKMGWAHVAGAEGGGWVALRYLMRQPQQSDERLPQPLVCGGTEPFWSLDLTGGDSAVFSEPGRKDYLLSRKWERTAEGSPPIDFVVVLAGAQGSVTALISRESCSDGMSDRPYGLSARVATDGAMKRRLLRGCCYLPGGRD